MPWWHGLCTHDSLYMQQVVILAGERNSLAALAMALTQGIDRLIHFEQQHTPHIIADRALRPEERADALPRVTGSIR